MPAASEDVPRVCDRFGKTRGESRLVPDDFPNRFAKPATVLIAKEGGRDYDLLSVTIGAIVYHSGPQHRQRSRSKSDLF
jgi:hypothetical protein